MLLNKQQWREVAEKLKLEFPDLATINITAGIYLVYLISSFELRSEVTK